MINSLLTVVTYERETTKFSRHDGLVLNTEGGNYLPPPHPDPTSEKDDHEERINDKVKRRKCI